MLTGVVRDEPYRALAGLIRLAAPDQHGTAVLAERDVLDVERHQLAAPRQGVVSHRDQRLVAQIACALAQRADDLIDDLAGERRGLALPCALGLGNALERHLDDRGRGRRLDTGCPVQMGDRSDIAPYRGRCSCRAHGVDVGYQRLGRGREHLVAVIDAPRREDRGIVSHGPFRLGAVCALGMSGVVRELGRDFVGGGDRRQHDSPHRRYRHTVSVHGNECSHALSGE